MFSTDRTEVSEGNREDFADLEVLISRTALRRSDWMPGSWGENSIIGDCSRIIDTGFYGGALCRFNLTRKYKNYSGSIYHLMPQFEKTVEKTNGVCFFGIMGLGIRSVQLFPYLVGGRGFL